MEYGAGGGLGGGGGGGTERGTVAGSEGVPVGNCYCGALPSFLTSTCT